MITLKPIAANAENFRPFGILYELGENGGPEDGIRSAGDGYIDAYTKAPLIDRPGNLGMTQAAAAPRIIEKMERHLHTREALLCAGAPLAFLAAPEGGESPEVRDVKAFALRPGQVAVFCRGVWHSAALGLNAPVSYYWLAEAYDGEPTAWKEIAGGPVQLDSPAEG